ncbi:MAG TPA: SGNH/GDSL hydrolase family protein [Chthoniobacteraceae bacterium]
MTRSSFALALLLPLAAALAQTPSTPAPAVPPAPSELKTLVGKLDLQDGDTHVFLGDSITHQCLYTQYVEDYFYTRFPRRRIRFHNAGVGGDRAADALTRFEEDVAVYKPKTVTVLLGMNDGSYRDFDQATFATYQRGMNAVLDKIAALGATAVPMTPTLFDARAKRMRNDLNEPRNTYYNGVLALYGAWLREQAEVRGLGFVDMWSPLTAITLRERKTDPRFTMIRDGIHPEAVGQAVMAMAVIDDMVERSVVSEIVVSKTAEAFQAKATGGAAPTVEKSGEGLSFIFTSEALPWVLPIDAAKAIPLTNFVSRFSSEKLIVAQLAEGNYALSIDGVQIGAFSAADLARGIELGGNEKTPQYQQAVQVTLLNKQRNDQFYHPLRDTYGQLKGKRRDLARIKSAPGADPAVLEAKQAEFDQWYAGQKSTVAELLAGARKIEDRIYELNQPKQRKYELVPVPVRQ